MRLFDDAREFYGVFGIIRCNIRHDSRLFMNFFEHEKRVGSLFYFADGPGERLFLRFYACTGPGVKHHHALSGYECHFIVFQEMHLARVGEHGRRIASEKVFPVAKAHHERRAASDCHELMIIFIHGDKGVQSLHVVERFLHGFAKEHGFGVFFDQMYGNFRIGLGYKAVALFQKFLFERLVIFQNPVVDDGNTAGAIQMRVGVHFTHTAVRGPARVAKGKRARWHVFDVCLTDLAGFFLDDDFIACPRRHHCYPPRVIAAVFQLFQSFQYDGRAVCTGTDITKNATHSFCMLCPKESIVKFWQL